MSRFSTFGFLNPFVQSKWKERAAKREADARKRRKKAARAATPSNTQEIEP